MNTGDASPNSSEHIYYGRGGAYTLSPLVFFLSRAFALSLLALLIASDFSPVATAVVAMFAFVSLFGLMRQFKVSMSIDDKAITMPGNSRHGKDLRFPLSSIESLRAFPLPHGVALWVTSGNGSTNKEVLPIIVSYEVFDRIRQHLSQLNVPLLGIPQQAARELKNAVFAIISASLVIGVVYLLVLYGVVLFFTEPDHMGAYFEPPLYECSGMVALGNNLYVLNPRFSTIHHYDARGDSVDYWTIRNIKILRLCLTDTDTLAVPADRGLYLLQSGGVVARDITGQCTRMLKPSKSLIFNNEKLTLSEQGKTVMMGSGHKQHQWIASGWLRQKFSGRPGPMGIGLALVGLAFILLGKLLSGLMARILNRAQTEIL